MKMTEKCKFLKNENIVHDNAVKSVKREACAAKRFTVIKTIIRLAADFTQPRGLRVMNNSFNFSLHLFYVNMSTIGVSNIE